MTVKKQPTKHRPPTPATLKQLVGTALSCGKPDCREPLYKRDTPKEWALNHNVAHIRARSENGPRWDNDMTESQNRSLSNLLPLCLEHASLIDQKALEDSYPVPLLERWKETQLSEFDFALRPWDPEDLDMLELMEVSFTSVLYFSKRKYDDAAESARRRIGHSGAQTKYQMINRYCSTREPKTLPDVIGMQDRDLRGQAFIAKDVEELQIGILSIKGLGWLAGQGLRDDEQALQMFFAHATTLIGAQNVDMYLFGSLDNYAHPNDIGALPDGQGASSSAEFLSRLVAAELEREGDYNKLRTDEQVEGTDHDRLAFCRSAARHHESKDWWAPVRLREPAFICGLVDTLEIADNGNVALIAPLVAISKMPRLNSF